MADSLETERLSLHPWSEADRSLFAALAADPRVMRYIGDGSTWDHDRTHEVFERQLRHWTDHGFGWRSATNKANSQRVGFIGLNHVGPEAIEVTEDEVEIGWWLDPRYWRQGLATEGALALRDEGFTRAELPRIIGRYQPANVASGRIMESLGMILETDAIGSHGDLVRIFSLSRDRWTQMIASSQG